jgi:hypothetical protein
LPPCGGNPIIFVPRTAGMGEHNFISLFLVFSRSQLNIPSKSYFWNIKFFSAHPHVPFLVTSQDKTGYVKILF